MEFFFGKIADGLLFSSIYKILQDDSQSANFESGEKHAADDKEKKKVTCPRRARLEFYSHSRLYSRPLRRQDFRNDTCVIERHGGKSLLFGGLDELRQDDE